MTKTGALALRVGLGAAIVYLGAHAVTGRQGLMAYVDLQERQQTLRATLEALEQERDALQARANRLRPDSLDVDYLEERAEISLGARDQAEVVFLLEPAG